MNELKFLKSVPIMKSVNGIEPLLSQGKIIIKKYAKGETLYNQGSSCSSLDIVVMGSLKVYSLTENGSSTIMFEFKKDSIIGANLLFAPENIYPLNIYCSSECELVHIEKNSSRNIASRLRFCDVIH